MSESVPITTLRRFPVGAEPVADGGTHFRVWAPAAQRLHLVLFEGESIAERVLLDRDAEGYHAGYCPSVKPGTFYAFELDGSTRCLPDPASRFQPRGPDGPSQVIDPSAYRWSDSAWQGPELRGQVIYEMHVGTFTHEGTWRAAARELEALARLGVTLIEVMPVSDFPGRFGWGYDGVNLYAPTRLYGTPDAFREFVDCAHTLGVAVILDVVYNHFGTESNHLSSFAREYFTDRHPAEWGPVFNFDGPRAAAVREFVLSNARYWIEEFHLDGLRLDATQSIFDDSPEHVIAAITRAVREAARGRRTFIVAENEPQDVRLVRPSEQGGYDVNALWNDDFHHSAMVVLSGRNEAYYSDHLGNPQEFISAAKYGYLFQGQRYEWQKQRRGTPTRGLTPEVFVAFIQNHDQVANSGRGARCHELTSPGRLRAMTALLLLGPWTPMLFQGQEFASSSPFFYFAYHEEGIAQKVDAGRKQFMAQFRSIAESEGQAQLPDPADPTTFMRSKLDFLERHTHAHVYALHRDLLSLRREQPAFRAQRAFGVDGAVLAAEAFVLRFFGATDPEEDRLLVVNFGRDLHLRPAPEPLLAPPQGSRAWQVSWSSEDLRYGGTGTAPVDTDENWRIPGHAAVVLRPASPADASANGT